jgi:competence protein ComEA
MPKKSQFQNLVLQQILQDYAQQATMIQPALTLPIKTEALVPLPLSRPLLAGETGLEPVRHNSRELRLSASDTQTEIDTPVPGGTRLSPDDAPQPTRRKKRFVRGVALFISVLLMLAIGLIWHSATPTSASPGVMQQAYSSPISLSSPQALEDATATTGTSTGTIQVYIVGAIKHPGVYTLPAGARVYQLIQAAGGTRPNANLVSLNLAAKLSDGQEIYVLSIGETPPVSSGAPVSTSATSMPTGEPVNINTATASDMEKNLHVSSTTANKIITYRTEHGAYTSVEQLLQVVSKSIYDRIKDLVTV